MGSERYIGTLADLALFTSPLITCFSFRACGAENKRFRLVFREGKMTNNSENKHRGAGGGGRGGNGGGVTQ